MVAAMEVAPKKTRSRSRKPKAEAEAEAGAEAQVAAEAARSLVSRMEENRAFGQVRLGYDTTQPQLFIEVDRARAADLGIRIEGLGEALQAVLDGRGGAREAPRGAARGRDPLEKREKYAIFRFATLSFRPLSPTIGHSNRLQADGAKPPQSRGRQT